jgi:hypothetical protein
MTTLAIRAGAQLTTQSAPAPKAIIIGQVVDGASGQPIPSAIVTLDRSTRVMTTSDGRFVFRNLNPGDYRLSATKSGYLAGEFGVQRPHGSSRSLVIAAGQRRRDVVLRLWRHAAITGTVADEVGEPLIGVNVAALRRTTTGGRVKFVMEGYTTTTDDRGMYRISRLVPGTYVVQIRSQHVTVPAEVLQHANDGFVEAAFGRKPTGGLRLQQSLIDIDGFIGIEANFFTRQFDGYTQMMSPEMPTPPPAGTFTLLVYPTMYHPNAATLSAASLITVTSGQERTGVNLQVSPVAAARVSGIVSAPEGSAAYVPIRLAPVDSERVERDAISTMTDANGRFTFLAVPSGDYTLRVTVTPPSVTFADSFTIIDTSGAAVSANAPPEPSAKPDSPPSTLWASIPLSVADANVTDLSIVLKNGFTISGQVEFEGSERPPTEETAKTAIYVEPANSDMARIELMPAPLDKSDHFTTVPLPPGRYLLQVMNVPNRWSLKSATAGERDISGVPIEIDSRNVANVLFTLTDRPTALSGSVQRSEDSLRRGAVVIVFPTDSAAWIEKEVVSLRIRKAPVAESGHYEFRALLPGDYYLAAIPEGAAEDWQDPTLLQQLVAGAAHVQLGDGEKALRDVRLQELR